MLKAEQILQIESDGAVTSQLYPVHGACCDYPDGPSGNPS
jgi:hypothetical protein